MICSVMLAEDEESLNSWTNGWELREASVDIHNAFSCT